MTLGFQVVKDEKDEKAGCEVAEYDQAGSNNIDHALLHFCLIMFSGQHDWRYFLGSMSLMPPVTGLLLLREVCVKMLDEVDAPYRRSYAPRDVLKII